MTRSRWAVAGAIAAMSAGCKSAPAVAIDGGGVVSTASTALGAPANKAESNDTASAVQVLATSPTATSPLRARSPAKASETIAIPAGTFVTGSTPGDELRDPTVEPAFVNATMTAYAIDALPYPNDPAQPPRTNVPRAEAQSLCAQRGERLCTELEWEHACKGPDDDKYASGASWDDACAREPTTCASGFGARAMGTIREWTASDLGSSPSVRGAGALDEDGGAALPGTHRCARRTAAHGARTSNDIGFRCCKGEPNAATIAPIELKPGFRQTKMEAADVARVFASVPELARVGTNIRLSTPIEADSIVGPKSNARATITFATQPILWEPEAGNELLVTTGRGKGMSFIVALYPLPNDKYRIASSFLLLNEQSPVVLAYDPHNRKELLWTQCWGCTGEQGSVSLRDDHHVVIVQH